MVIIHTFCSLLSYVAFLIAFVSGALFLLQDRQLKHKQMGWLFHRLPSLDILDRINLVSIGVGFGLLSLGLFFGMAGSRLLLGRWWQWGAKESLTLILWASYLALWLVRLRATLRGRKVAVLSMLGFLLVVFTCVGANRLFGSWHNFNDWSTGFGRTNGARG